jgi:arylsulfatase A-like enzyme
MKAFMWILATGLLVSTVVTNHAEDVRKPNLIIILADDMGYSDPACYGGEIPTPALDKMAAEGLRLTRFYNCGMCVVSRASMLGGNWWPQAKRNFKQAEILPERLRSAGYRTGLIGKWHLDGHPMDHGFDHFFGFLDGFADHFDGSPSYRLNRARFDDFGPDFYSSDALTDGALKFIQSSEQPFFLYLAYQAPHNPLQAPKDDIMKFRGRYLKGWQKIREARFMKQKELGIVARDAALPPYPGNLPPWESLTPEQMDLEDLRMSVYAAMVARMDQGIGRVMDAVHAIGSSRPTLVLFMSDNGADSFSVMDAEMLKRGKLPGDRASNWQPGTGCAYASVTPWRLYKISQHAGGVTSGAIAWWNGGPPGNAGSISDSPIHMVDVMPTFMRFAGENLNTAGESFAPLLTGETWKRARPMFFQYLDNRAIRTTSHALVEVDGNGWELFDARADRQETRDLAKEKPEVVATLEKQWLDWWAAQGMKNGYQPEPSRGSQHYRPQGDRGSGDAYPPSTMPAALSGKYPVPTR